MVDTENNDIYVLFLYSPLVWLGMKIFAAFDACKLLKIDETTLKNWLGLIEEHYRADNPYHNATHAADVLQVSGLPMCILYATCNTYNVVGFRPASW